MDKKSINIEKNIVINWNNEESNEIIDYLRYNGIKGTAEHIGNKQFSPTVEWSKYNNKKSYGKTDIKISKTKISLKSMNDHITMAAKKNEALATFMCVADTFYGYEITNALNDIDDVLSNMVSGVSPVTIAKAKKMGLPDILKADEQHKKILEKIKKIFEDHTFATYFIKEVLSGELKFGKGSDGSATHILHITDRPILHSLNDINFLSDYTNNVNIRVDFKSSQKLQGSETGKYRYWSVLSIISKHLISENIINENIFNKISYMLKTILSNIKKTITSWTDVFDFLDIIPEISIIK